MPSSHWQTLKGAPDDASNTGEGVPYQGVVLSALGIGYMDAGFTKDGIESFRNAEKALCPSGAGKSLASMLPLPLA